MIKKRGYSHVPSTYGIQAPQCFMCTLFNVRELRRSLEDSFKKTDVKQITGTEIKKKMKPKLDFL